MIRLLLGDKTGLDRLAQTDVVGDQQADARRPQCPDDGIELVVLDLDPAPEVCLEGAILICDEAYQVTYAELGT